MFKNTKSHKNETPEHFITKVLIWKSLIENGHKATLEYDSGVGVFDVFDHTTGKIYEVEPVIKPAKTLSKWSQYKDCGFVKDLVVVPYRSLFKKVGVNSKSVKELLLEIKGYI
jgi:hypothetical protein